MSKRLILYAIDLTADRVLASYESSEERHEPAETRAQKHADKTGHTCAVVRGIRFFQREPRGGYEPNATE